MVQDVQMTEQTAAGKCPVDHGRRKTYARPVPDAGVQPLGRRADGAWEVHAHDLARRILRSDDTKQWGFGAHIKDKLPTAMRDPILWMDGPQHHVLRRNTARFFTPATTQKQHAEMMGRFVDEMVADFKRRGRIDLSELSVMLAVKVAGAIVGLTESDPRGMAQRLEQFFNANGLEAADMAWSWRRLRLIAQNQWITWRFYWWDVRPAVKKRQQKRRDDLISHLLDDGYKPMEILGECVTFGAAGMATTREFVSAAFWHLMEDDDLRGRYLSAERKERHLILGELLRLEPVVGRLVRRATADIHLGSVAGWDEPVTIAAGDLIEVDIRAANSDSDTVGGCPVEIEPDRELHGTMQPVMSFGDGHHRCPGAYVALEESDILLQKLLRVEGIRIEQAPQVGWDALIYGYEIRDFIIACD